MAPLRHELDPARGSSGVLSGLVDLAVISKLVDVRARARIWNGIVGIS